MLTMSLFIAANVLSKATAMHDPCPRHHHEGALNLKSRKHDEVPLSPPPVQVFRNGNEEKT